jgi:hypothetical protein
MKKWKVIFLSIAIVVGIGGAFASNFSRCGICGYYDQYRLYNGGYVLVLGEEGVTYACVGGAGTCTYYRPTLSSPYLPCKYGIFYELNATGTKK